MHNVTNSRWFRFSLATLFGVALVAAAWLAYEGRWIRQRHRFLARQAKLMATYEIGLEDYAAPNANHGTIDHRNPLPRSTSAVLWLFGERPRRDVYVVVRLTEDGPDYALLAAQLFPEVSAIHWVYVVQWSESDVDLDE